MTEMVNPNTATDRRPRQRMQLSIDWIQSVHSIEKPIEKGDFNTAKEMANIAIARGIDTESPIDTANSLFRQFCIPAHLLAYEWEHGRQSENFHDKLPNVYRDTMQLVDILTNSPLKDYRTKGLAAEVTVAGLINRKLDPVTSNYVALPSGIDEDYAPVIDGVHTGFDIAVHSRHEPQPIAVQVKYSRKGAELKQYSDDILVVSLEDLAKTEEDIPQLQKAMSMESLGYPTGWGHRLISKASQRLHSKMQYHQQKLALNQNTEA